jgi:predicted P-loop ATPase
MTYGATPEDWAHFGALGLEDDLLPVVSNPNAKIDPQSKMRDLGKTPSRYNQAGNAVGIPKWTQHVTSEHDIKRWIKERDYGICIQTRNVRGLDIDIRDKAAAAVVREFVEMGVGVLPLRRRSGTGKCLLAFRMPGDFAKRIIRTEHGLIEFLATGQQFIAIGTHPSGTRYEWVDGDGVLGLPASIPELTPAEFEALWQALVEQFAMPDGEHRVRNGLVPVKPRRSEDMRDSTVAWLDENGWVTGYERDGRVDVRCPWEHEHTSDSGPSSTSYFPAGVGGFEQGHFRCLHAHCAGRTDGDFLEATGLVTDEFDVVEAVANATGGADDVPLPAFTRTRGGQIEATINNVLMALRRPDVCGLHIGHDEFKNSLMVGEGGTWRPITDEVYTDLRSRLEIGRNGFKPIGRELVRDAVLKVALENKFDSAKQWAAGLVWDGVPRIDTFWIDHYSVPDNEYHRAVGKYTWTALAGRCVEPGCKADMVPVLIGLQGAGKTTAIEALCPIEEAFVEIDLTRKDDDIARSLRGKLVGEIAELKGLQGRDAESIKAWVSRRVEEWTPKYREFTTRFARRFLPIGTGNNEGFLDDDTGERRWLPMTVGVVDVAAVRTARDQLWAEGIARFKANGVEWQGAQRLALEVHGRYKAGDPWLEPIHDWLQRDDMDQFSDLGRRADRPVSTNEVLTSALSFSTHRITRKDELRVGRVMRLLRFEKRDTRREGHVVKRWVRAEACEPAGRDERGAFSDLA